MKFTTKAGEFGGAVARIASVCRGDRAGHNLLVVKATKGEGLMLAGCGLTFAVELPLEVGVKKEGEIAVRARELRNLLSALPKRTDLVVTLEKKGASLKIESEDDKFTLPTHELDYVSKPVWPDQSGEPATIPLDRLLELTDQTGFAADANDFRGTMYGYDAIKLELGDEWTAIATDANRMAVSEREGEVGGSVEMKLPLKTVSLLRGMGEGLDNPEVSIWVIEDEKLVFRVGDSRLLAHLEQKTFPDWRGDMLTDKTTRAKLTVNREEFLKAVERATVLCQNEDTLRLCFLPNEVRFSALGKIVSWEAKGTFAITENWLEPGGEIEIAFDPKIFKDGLRASKAKVLEIWFPKKLDRLEFHDDQGFRYVVMPLELSKVSFPTGGDWPRAEAEEEEIVL